MQDNSISSDGWEQLEEIKFVETDQNRRSKIHFQKPLTIVQNNQYSLQPDMVSGWRPKLPQCPLPLSYQNLYVDSLKRHLYFNKSSNIVYKGQRLNNSVKVNQRHSYYWKYRAKYSMNINVVKEAIQNVGLQKDMSSIQISECAHKFDSSFESGNLDLVLRVKQNQYDCFLRSDTNTKGHSNWFYFKVQNNEKLGPIRLNICNLTKYKSLYSKGMRPYCKIGQNGEWSQQQCYDVNFYERLCRYGLSFKTNQLQFSFNFSEPYQTIFFSYAIPYTYTDLQNFVNWLKENEKNYVKISPLCQSLGGVELPLITIEMNKAKQSKLQRLISRKSNKKKAIVITARIHPGQTHSSYLLEGFIKKLMQDKNKLEQILFNQYTFYLVPMLNPDGVIVGNFRTSYSGRDLNRQFNDIDKYIYPQIYALKQFCDKVKLEGKQIQYYFDFHTHSSKKGLFCYGPEHPQYSIKYFKARAIAKVIQSMGDIFSYRDSIFTISQEKINTGRAFMLRKINASMSFTFQVSNGLYNDKQKNVLCLDKNTLHEAGGVICDGLTRYIQIDLNSCFRKVINKNNNIKYSEKKIISQSKYSSRNSTKKQFLPRNEILSAWRHSNVDSSQEWKYKPSKDCTLLQIINQIKSEKNDEVNYIEGGSDSQSSNEDLQEEQKNYLFNFIKSRDQIQNRHQHKALVEVPVPEIIKNQVLEQKKDKIIIQNLKLPRQNFILSFKKPASLLNLKTYSKVARLKKTANLQSSKIVIPPKHFTLII